MTKEDELLATHILGKLLNDKITEIDPFAHLGWCIDLISQYECDHGEMMFLGRPDRWYEKPAWRCPNEHVSRVYLKSEEKGDLCLACHENVRLTFPEDIEGPLCHPAVIPCLARGILGGKCCRPVHHPGKKHIEVGFVEWEDES